MSEIDQRRHQQHSSPSRPMAAITSSPPTPPPPSHTHSVSTFDKQQQSSLPSIQIQPSSSTSSSSSSKVKIYHIDAGIIRCICGFSEDDGFTIQCENCHVWQHAVCVNITDNAQVPDVYLCDKCGKLSYDVEAAKKLQSRRLHLQSSESKGTNHLSLFIAIVLTFMQILTFHHHF